MNPNFTFFVQIINFSITYWFLNTFMFKPVLLFLKKKKAKEKRLQEGIKKKEDNLLILSKSKESDLIKFKEKMKKRYCIEAVELPTFPAKIVGKVDKKEAKTLIEAVKNVLVKKVPHVD